MMGSISNKSKQRYNAEHYAQVKVSVSPEIATKFKAECMANGVSMASEISRFMSGQNSNRYNNKPISVATRQHRRKSTVKLIEQLEVILDAELQYKDNIPINLQSAPMYESAEQAISALEDALGSLYEAY